MDKTHVVEIYSPLTDAAYYRTAAMSEGKAQEVADAYNEGRSEDRAQYTAARVKVKPDRPQGTPRQREELGDRAGHKSWWD